MRVLILRLQVTHNDYDLITHLHFFSEELVLMLAALVNVWVFIIKISDVPTPVTDLASGYKAEN